MAENYNNIPVGKNVLADAGNPKYAGVYVRKNKEGKITWRLYYRAYGKQIWETLKGNYTKESARRVRAERLGEIDRGEFLQPSENKLTYDGAFDLWKTWATCNISQGALHNDSLKYKNHIQPHLGKLQLQAITTGKLEQWKKYLLEDSGLKEQTASLVMTLAVRIWNKAEFLGGYTGKNPWKQVKRISKQVFRQRFLSMEEAKQIMSGLQGMGWTREYRQASFGLLAGLRLPSEVMDLTPMSIDLEHNKITIGLSRGKVKGGKATRTVPLAPALKQIVKDMYAEKQYGPLDPLFESWNYKKWQRIFEPFNEGIPSDETALRITPYTLRHTYASWLLKNGANLKAIQGVMGHATFKMTSDIYAKVASDAAEEAQEKLNAAIAKGELEGVW